MGFQYSGGRMHHDRFHATSVSKGYLVYMTAQTVKIPKYCMHLIRPKI